MNTTNFDVAMQPFFEKLNIDPMEFVYDEETNSFISQASFINDDNDPMEYVIVVKLYKNCGNVCIGYSDGVKFYETAMLGQIMFENNKWNSLI